MSTSHENTSSSSSSAVALAFMKALKEHSSRQAYYYLGDALLIAMSTDDFTRQVALADTCAGSMTAFQPIQRQVGWRQARYTYKVVRGKLSKSYLFTLSLQQDGQGKWGITDYGDGGYLVPRSVACR